MAAPNFSIDIMETLFFRTFLRQQLQLGSPARGATAAAMMLLIIPVLILYLIFSRQLIRGITSGAVK